MKKNYIQIAVDAIVLIAIVVVCVRYMPSLTMQDIVLWYRDNLNYGTIMLLMALESSFIPFPSEIVIPPAAYFSAHNGDLNTFLIVLFATFGALIGAFINYFIALFIGRPLIHAFAESKFGHICMLSSEKVDNAEKYFDLNKTEKEIIKKHMWPVTIIMPKRKETWIVVWADKVCAIKELLNIPNRQNHIEKIKNLIQ